MKTLDRYIVRNFLYMALLWFLIFMSLRIVVDMFVNLDEFSERGAGFGQAASRIAEYYSYQILVYFSQLGGVIIVLSAVFTIAIMNRTNELVAMLASGVSLHRVILPIVICAMALGGLVIVDQELLIPPVAPKLARSHDAMETSRNFPLRLISDGDHAAWFSLKFTPRDSVMASPIVFLRDEKLEPLGMILGGEARPATLQSEAGWKLTDARLVNATQTWPAIPTTGQIASSVSPVRVLAEALRGHGSPVSSKQPVHVPNSVIDDATYGMSISAEAWRYEGAATDEARPVTLMRPVFTFRAVGQSEAEGKPVKVTSVLGRFFADSATWRPPTSRGPGVWELHNGGLFRPSDLTNDDIELRRSSNWLDFMSSSELDRLLKLRRVPDRQAAMLVRQIRLTDPINNLIMLLLGLPFVLSRERHIKASILMCLMTVGAFFVLIYICRYLEINPALAAWLPILLFGPVAVMMLDAVKT